MEEKKGGVIKQEVDVCVKGNTETNRHLQQIAPLVVGAPWEGPRGASSHLHFHSQAQTAAVSGNSKVKIRNNRDDECFCHKHASKPKQQKPRTISKQTPHIPHNTQSKGYKCQQKQRLRRTAVLVRLEAGRELTLPDSSANLLRTSNETNEIRSEGPGHRTFTEP